MTKIIPIGIDTKRAVIHTIDSFGGLSVAVWEYVANGIDYIVEGTKPEIEVLIEKDKISFADQGRGMDVEDLTHFFKIHAENRDRISGSYTFLRRGYFGTGGFSIFSIANHLKIISVKAGKLYSGEVSRADVIKAKGFKLEKIGVKTDLPNGTKFEATKLNNEIFQKDIKNIKEYVLKQMKRSKGASVWINSDPIEYKEPPIDKEFTKTIYSKDTKFFKDLNELGFGAGKIKLTLKKSKKPLQKGEYGVAISADGKLLEICAPGIETKKYCDYIIGDAEIENLYPNLHKFSPPLFDQTRRLELKLENKYVLKLRSFIGVQLEQFEKEISEFQKNRERTESEKELNKKLAQMTEKANKFLKDELDQLELNSSNQQNLSSKSKRNSLLKEAIAKIIKPGDEFYKKKYRPSNPNPNPNPVPFDKNIKKRNNSILENEKTKKNNSGGLKIIQEAMGEETLRADFHAKDGTIIINTDFPPIKRIMKKGDYENKELDLLLKEIASTELAVAITQHLIGKGELGDITIAMVDLRKRINDYSLKFDSITV